MLLLSSPRLFLCKVLKENFKGKIFHPCRAALEEVEGDVTELELKLDKVSLIQQCLFSKIHKDVFRFCLKVHSWEVAVANQTFRSWRGNRSGSSAQLGLRGPSFSKQQDPE